MLRRPILGHLPYYWYESIAPGAYGGPIFQASPSSDHYAIFEKALAHYRNLLLVSNPFSDWYPTKNLSRYETFIQILRLSSDFNNIWRGYSKGRRHTVNYAKKKGVRVSEVNFCENYHAYFEIYQKQLARWGHDATDYYPLRLFENLASLAQKQPEIKLWAAWLDDTMVSGLIVFSYHHHVVTWHGATLEEYFEYRPVDLLYSTVIENACQEGFKVFDFANSGGHQSVVEYKERFGAVRLPLYLCRRRNIGGKIYRMRRHVRNRMRRCPEE
jgi:hypothetical protein